MCTYELTRCGGHYSGSIFTKFYEKSRLKKLGGSFSMKSSILLEMHRTPTLVCSWSACFIAFVCLDLANTISFLSCSAWYTDSCPPACKKRHINCNRNASEAYTTHSPARLVRDLFLGFYQQVSGALFERLISLGDVPDILIGIMDICDKWCGLVFH